MAASDTITALREEVRDWIAANPVEPVRLSGAHEQMGYHSSEVKVRWTQALREGRWLCLSWPVEYGGRGLGPLEVIAVNEEFAHAGLERIRLGMGETLVAPAILEHGTPEQKRRFLPRILSGEDVYCQGFSEPEAGSDLARLRTRAVRDGEELVITGDKIWQSGAHQANMIFTLCRTDPDAPRHRGISYVLVPMADNGIRVEGIRMMSGDYGFNQVHFEAARAPVANVIGGLNNGWRTAMTTLGAERAGEATTQYLGYRDELFALAGALGLGPDDADRVPERLTDAYLQVELMRASGRAIADTLELGGTADRLLAVDKINWSEYHVWFGEMAIDELGLAGAVLPDGDDYTLTLFQRVMLESRGRRIARGTNQIQRNIIAERVLGLPR